MLRANFVEKAEEWKWGTAAIRRLKPIDRTWLAIPSEPALPRQWRSFVNKPQTESEVIALRQCVVRGTPFGKTGWVHNTAVRLSLESTTRPRGRPKKKKT